MFFKIKCWSRLMANLTFLIGCIGTRLLLAFAGHHFPEIVGKLLLIPMTGFMVIYLFGLRKTGIETGGKPIWWNQLRPVHALIYLLFYLNSQSGGASGLLVLDALIGLTAHLVHHQYI